MKTFYAKDKKMLGENGSKNHKKGIKRHALFFST